MISLKYWPPPYCDSEYSHLKFVFLPDFVLCFSQFCVIYSVRFLDVVYWVRSHHIIIILIIIISLFLLLGSLSIENKKNKRIFYVRMTKKTSYYRALKDIFE